MATKTLGTELAEEMAEGVDGHEFEGCTVVEGGKWELDYASSRDGQRREIVFECRGKYYKLVRTCIPAGDEISHDSDYQKEWECAEVEKVEVVSHEWKVVDPPHPRLG